MQTVVHPGPVRADRMDLVACDGSEIEVTLAAGIPLEDAVSDALAPLRLDSAWVEILEADVSTLRYVIPAEAPDRANVAWYSETKGFEAGRIDQLGMIVGRHQGASFLHGHGTWSAKGRDQAMGHILAPQTVLASPAKVQGVGLRGARFDRRSDAETSFDLFHVDQIGSGEGDFAALHLLPNQDLSEGIETACNRLGWAAARVHGIGSINMPKFANGRQLNSLPTEFLIRDASAPVSEGPDIIVVGTDPDDIQSGRLARGENAILVTAELVLSRTG